MDDLLLRELCRLTGVTRRAVQGYEKEGLVSPSGKTNMDICYTTPLQLSE